LLPEFVGKCLQLHLRPKNEGNTSLKNVSKRKPRISRYYEKKNSVFIALYQSDNLSATNRSAVSKAGVNRLPDGCELSHCLSDLTRATSGEFAGQLRR
jgi:hypothetical protein